MPFGLSDVLINDKKTQKALPQKWAIIFDPRWGERKILMMIKRDVFLNWNA